MRGLTVVVLMLLLGGCSFSAPGVHALIGEPAHIYIDGYDGYRDMAVDSARRDTA